MPYKKGDKVTLSCDVKLHTGYGATLRKGESGVVTGDYANNLTGVFFAARSITVLIGQHQMVHAVDELAVLRAQVAARDAALDAVLELAKQAQDSFCDITAHGLLALLLKHGVHPK